ncbi:hypothetical protein RFI_33621, partial [Reticulomyxa filosa]
MCKRREIARILLNDEELERPQGSQSVATSFYGESGVRNDQMTTTVTATATVTATIATVTATTATTKIREEEKRKNKNKEGEGEDRNDNANAKKNRFQFWSFEKNSKKNSTLIDTHTKVGSNDD